ncbi:alkyl sulfatase dimerization domain-containing protein [Streptomyces sp. NPDC102283]|uniref:alkyl sulfatase dimerization domain-containing protein n=1 Tax=Streptomyces sp. NPDC102283 TaxID=3366155 RepID=UPI0037FBEE61
MLSGADPEELRTRLAELPSYLDTTRSPGRCTTVAGKAARQFTGYLGWFTGHAADLAPTPAAERARRTIAFMGGHQQVLDAAATALNDDDPRSGPSNCPATWSPPSEPTRKPATSHPPRHLGGQPGGHGRPRPRTPRRSGRRRREAGASHRLGHRGRHR